MKRISNRLWGALPQQKLYVLNVEGKRRLSMVHGMITVVKVELQLLDNRELTAYMLARLEDAEAALDDFMSALCILINPPSDQDTLPDTATS
jgi:hypothetical protein